MESAASAGGPRRIERGRARPAGAAGPGFSLVEMLVALVLSGVVAGTVVRLLLSQGGFYGWNDDRTYAQQGVRAAADLVSTELGMATAPELLAARRESVSVRSDLLRGVVCSADGEGGTAALYLHERITDANLPARFRGFAFSDPRSASWDRTEWSGTAEPTVSLEDGGRAVCERRGAPAGGADWRYRTVAGLSRAFDSLPDRGAVAAVYGRLTYSLEPSSFDANALAIRRNSQELVSPVAGGAAFAYVVEDGGVRPGVPPEDLERVRAIRLHAAALGPGADRHGVERELRLVLRLEE